MSLSSPRAGSRPGASPAQPPAAEPKACPQCGGSGQLRLGDQRFRTCLRCLGQGVITPQQRGTLSAAASASDAR